MLLTVVFLRLSTFNLRFLPMFMLPFSLGKQSAHVLFEGRISVGTLRFTLAYLALIFDRNLSIDRFIMTFIGIGVVY